MDSKNQCRRKQLHESVNLSFTAFLKSWCVLFVFTTYLAVAYLAEFSAWSKPLVLTYIDSADAQANLFVLSVVLYFFATVTLPFFACYVARLWFVRWRASSKDSVR